MLKQKCTFTRQNKKWKYSKCPFQTELGSKALKCSCFWPLGSPGESHGPAHWVVLGAEELRLRELRPVGFSYFSRKFVYFFIVSTLFFHRHWEPCKHIVNKWISKDFCEIFVFLTNLLMCSSSWILCARNRVYNCSVLGACVHCTAELESGSWVV